ncbi:UNVERIFIED_CONTAM: hypothetical protein PYX00_007210 [Menopon gallinae]|uniref:Amine oxidase domain-containing protein n=1 Tax=Menopon gallinae TaxID=328185 RepID=A0AAW2HIA0_9NEOP
MAAASDKDDKNFSEIIIIGGGIAGLSAAYHLVKNGVTDFKILEARQKLGGRIDAAETGAHSVDLGASWIHGVLGNPIYEIAMTHGLIDIIHMQRPHKVVAALEDGSQVPFSVLQEIYEAYTCFLRRCEEYFLCQYLPPEGITNVGDHICLEASLYLDKIKDEQERHMKKLIFNCLLKRETCITGCDNMTDIDLLELGSYTELQGGNISLPTGYRSILKPITSEIPDSNILLNHTVDFIRWKNRESTNLTSPGYDSGIDLLASGDTNNDSDSDKTVTEGNSRRNSVIERSSVEPESEKGVISECSERVKELGNIEVVCENGARFLGNHAICTIPLGVLKEKALKMFSPKLPQEKLDSIKRLSFGTVNKIYLEYARPFLNPEVSEVLLLWDRSPDDDDISLSWFKKIYSFAKVTDTLILAWISGREARYLETLPTAVIGEKCTQVLRKFLNDPYIPLPKVCVVSKWFSDECFRGSYTAIAVGASQVDIENIAQPIYGDIDHKKPVLLFAGEHTHASFYSTVHGAYLTGRSAAQSLITHEENEIELTCNDTSDLSSWIQGISLDQ